MQSIMLILMSAGNAKASMLYLEQPAGVGFSYCAKTAPSCTFTDVTQAADTFKFLEKFFDGFPELKENEFFITGESCESTCCRLRSAEDALN